MSKLMFLVTLPILFTGCFGHTKATIEDVIGGTYVRDTHDPALNLWDTLAITPPADRATHLFAITKNSRIVRSGDHRQPPSNRLRHIEWTAIYDAASKSLVVLETGEHFYYLPSREVLTNGQLTYSRMDALSSLQFKLK